MNQSEAASGLAWNTLLALAAKVVLPIVGIIIARLIGPTEIGIFAIVAAVAGVVDIFRDAGLAQSFISEKDSDPVNDRAYGTLALLIAAILALATFSSRAWFAKVLHQPELEWGLTVISATFLISGFSTIPFAKLQREARFKEASLVEIAALVASYAVAAVLAFSGFGYRALVLQMLTRVVLLTGAAYVLAPVGFGALRKEFVLPLWRRSTTILFGSVISSMYTLADNLLIARLFGSSATGLYATAFNVAMKPVELISWPLSRTMFVAYSRAQADMERLRHVFYKSVTGAALLTLPLYAFLLTQGSEVVLALYGTRFAGSGALLSILAIYLGTRSIGTLCGGVLIATRRTGLGNLAWIVGYAVGGSGIAWQWHSLTLASTTMWLTAGASTAYVLGTVFAMRCVPPDSKNRANLGKLAVVTLVLGVFCAATRWVPVSDLARVLGTAALLPPLGLMLIGILYEGSPFACFGKRGIARFWAKL